MIELLALKFFKAFKSFKESAGCCSAFPKGSAPTALKPRTKPKNKRFQKSTLLYIY